MKRYRQPLSLFSIGIKWETQRAIEHCIFSVEWLTCIYHKGFFHWDTREIRSARWLQLCTPRHYADCCTQLGVFHKTAESTFKNQQHDNDWNWAALFSDRQTETTNHHLQMLLYILFFALSLQNEKEKHRDFPNNVSGKYVCLIVLNISECSYIKHSLYSRLPLFYLFILARTSSGVKQQHARCFGYTLLLNKHANMLVYSLTFWIPVTVAPHSYHISSVILYLNTRREKPK